MVDRFRAMHRRWFIGFVLLSLGPPQTAMSLQTRARADSTPDIQHYDLVIRPELASRRLRTTATVSVANPSREAEFTFLLADWYDSVAVRGRSGSATVERSAGMVTVRLPLAGPTERVVFTLSGVPGRSAADDRPVIADSGIYSRSRTGSTPWTSTTGPA